MMLFYRILFMVFLFIAAFESQSLAASQESPPMHKRLQRIDKTLLKKLKETDNSTFLLGWHYNILHRILKEKQKKSISELSISLDHFMSSIAFPINTQFNNGRIAINYNQETFLNIAMSIFNNLNAVDDDFLNSTMENSLKALSARVRLAKIDENVRLGHGIRGHFVNAHLLSENASNALRNLTGRVFLIKVDANDNWDILSASSGTLAHHNNHGGVNLAERLPPLTYGDHRPLNCIITCAHALKPLNENYREYRTEAYFVPGAALDPVSGLPHNQQITKLNELVYYLRTSQNSFKITRVHIQNKREPIPLGRFFETDMTMAEPQYFSDNEDCVIADIVPSAANGSWPTYTSNVTVNFFPHQALPIHARFFSIGYPKCFHYNLDAFEHHQHFDIMIGDEEVRGEGVSPIFITSSTKAPTFDSSGIINCDIPAARGMSGGGLFYENNETLNFFGCIKSIDEESGESAGNYLY